MFKTWDRNPRQQHEVHRRTSSGSDRSRCKPQVNPLRNLVGSDRSLAAQKYKHRSTGPARYSCRRSTRCLNMKPWQALASFKKLLCAERAQDLEGPLATFKFLGRYSESDPTLPRSPQQVFLSAFKTRRATPQQSPAQNPPGVHFRCKMRSLAMFNTHTQSPHRVCGLMPTSYCLSV